MWSSKNPKNAAKISLGKWSFILMAHAAMFTTARMQNLKSYVNDEILFHHKYKKFCNFCNIDEYGRH